MKTLIAVLSTTSALISLAGEPVEPLRLKRAVQDGDTVGATQTNKQFNRNRRHLILEFDQVPSPENLRALASRGIEVLAPVPDRGVMAAVPMGVDPSIDGLRKAARLAPSSKVSPLLETRTRASQWQTLVVEFHPDTTLGEARSIISQEGLLIREHPDLSRHHVLVRGPVEAIHALSAWDEVAYVFPASQALEDGVPVHLCAGALTNGGPVAQYITAIGPGWDGYGQGSATLTYSWDALSDRLPEDVIHGEVKRAMEQWAKAVQVAFKPGGHSNARRNINYLFARGNYGGPFPFDGQGRTLAQTFYPAPPNPEPVAGDVHFDDDEPWNVGTRIDLFSVSLHEIGHALGLAHSDNPHDVMYPYYRMASELSPGDIHAMQQIYAAALPPAPPEPETPAEPPVEPPNEQPAEPPANQPDDAPATPPADTPTDPPAEPPVEEPVAPPEPPPAEPVDDKTPPSLQIIQPATRTAMTRSDSLVIRGSATDNGGVASITWSSTRGSKGTATGTHFWQTAPIPLSMGTNVILIYATDLAGNRSWRALIVSRR